MRSSLKSPTRTPGGALGHLRTGLVLHRAGRIDDAIGAYRRALALEPGHPDGLHLLGAALLERSGPAEAIRWLERAIRARPLDAGYQLTLGNARLAAGDLAGAAVGYRAAIRLAPEGAAGYSNLGHALRLLGELPEAETALRRAVELAPDLADAVMNLGLARLERGDPREARTLLERTVELVPGSALARLNLGAARAAAGDRAGSAEAYAAAVALDPSLAAAHRNLAIAHQLDGRLAEAAAAYARALALDPADAEALTNLGVLRSQLDDLDGALVAHERAVALAPGMAAAWLNRATTLHQLGQLDHALASLDRALALDPASVEAWTARGVVLTESGAIEAALDAHDRAVTLDSDRPDPRFNRAVALLRSGRLERAWDEYESRWQASSRPAPFRTYPIPAWQGEPLDGKRLLVWREQGLGDEIMFATLVPELVARGAAVTLLATERLVGLLGQALPGVRVRPDGESIDPAEFDHHLPLGSLPRWLRRTRASFGSPRPLFRATAAARAPWAARLATLPAGRRVGVCWRSGLVTAARRRAYPPLEAWGSLWQLPGIVWVNLQYDECETELVLTEQASGVRIHRWPGVDLKQDLDSVVGLLAELDAVVTAPTAVSSLAGAVGVRTWQVDNGSDWTVFGARMSPWFPGLEVVSRTPGERGWTGVLERTAAGVGAWLAEGGQ